MQLEQRFTLAAPPEVAWPAFHRIELLVECLPGASLTGPAAVGEWPLRFDVKLGPITAGFVGTGRVSTDDRTHSGRFEGSATDKRTSSRVKGSASFAVEPGSSGSIVRITVDYALTGTLAQFSRGGLVRELASALTAQFAANLSARLQRPPHGLDSTASTDVALALPGAPASTEEAASRTDSPAPPAGQTMPLDGMALLRQIVRARWRRLLGWLRGAASG